MKYKIIGENITNIIMALLIGSGGCAFASLASEEYITINTDGNNKKYGVFDGKDGGSGCLGQCAIEKDTCEENNEYCILFKTLPILSGVCSLIATCLLTFTFEALSLKFNKQITVWAIMWAAFLFDIIGLLLHIFTPLTNGKTIWNIATNSDEYCTPEENLCIKWGEGFILMCTSVGLITLAITFHGINNTELWRKGIMEKVQKCS